MNYLNIMSGLGLLLGGASYASGSGANQPLPISTGTYTSAGVLRNSNLPDSRFTSLRTFGKGLGGQILTVHSEAHIKETKYTIDATLLFRATEDAGIEIFDLNDLDQFQKPKRVGSGSCPNGICTYTATLLQGAFTLTETLLQPIQEEDGTTPVFMITNAQQSSLLPTGGQLVMTYEAEFHSISN